MLRNRLLLRSSPFFAGRIRSSGSSKGSRHGASLLNFSTGPVSSSPSSSSSPSPSSESSSKTFVSPLKISAALAAAGLLYLISDEDRRLKAQRVPESAFRLINLVSTVGLISIDYGQEITRRKFHNWLSSNSNNSDNTKSSGSGSSSSSNEDYETLQQRLQGYQQDQEDYTIQQMKSNNKIEIENLQKLINETRKKIDIISEDIALLNGSPFSIIHKRSAKRLRDMCAQNKGLYIKLGQHLAMLDHVVPEEYQEELVTLLAATPTSSWASVERVIKQELGRYPNEIFKTFEEVPIASASLAQVHVAYGENGKKYAVKVQHEGLAESSSSDRLVITFLVSIISEIFEGFSYNWLAREMNLNLPKELNFEMEAANLKKCSLLLKSFLESGDVSIPKCYEDLSSKRVLTMEFESGCYISDQKAISNMQLSPADIARLVSVVFSEQLYRHGFCHCDPHEANLLVRNHPTKAGKPQLVLLDHGLYRDLGEKFRKDYCRLWNSIIMGNDEGIKKYCNELNAGQAYTLLAAMLTMRPWDDIVSEDMSRLKSKNTKGEQEMLKAYAVKYFKDIVNLLANVPSPMLLVLKTNDCLRHLDKKLGAPLNTASVVASITSEIIFWEDIKIAFEEKSIMKGVSVLYSYLCVASRIFGLNVIAFHLQVNSLLRETWQRLESWNSLIKIN